MGNSNRVEDWIASERKKGFKDDDLKEVLRRKGYKSEEITRFFDTAKKSGIKKVGPAPIVIIAAVAICISIFLIVGYVRDNRITDITPSHEVNQMISKDINRLWDRVDCKIPENESLINMIHITKSGSGYSIECVYGQAYDAANLNILNQEPNIYLGQIRKCDEETAKVIDDILINNGEKEDCRLPLSERKSFRSEDYYFYLVACDIYEVNDYWMDYIANKGLSCWDGLENAKGKKIAMGHMSGVVDAKTGEILI
jgi:hypothetical protein